MENQLKTSKLSDGIATSELILPNGYSAKVKVVKIHDGDTCHVHVIYDNQICRFVCRLAGIDTPEIGMPNSLIARDYLTHLCIGGAEGNFDKAVARLTETQLQNKLDENKFLIVATFNGRGFYNRALVTLQRAENSVKSFNTMLMEKGLAKKYQ